MVDQIRSREIAQANRAVVERLMQRLVKAFEDFAAEEGALTPNGLNYLDAQMGCHNFYKRIILDLEERTGKTGIIKKAAVDTLANSFNQ